MRKKLLDRTAKQLLNDFGTGGHEPGSGSAAAYTGSLAAQLTCNVIDLTEKYRRRSQTYQAHLDQFLKYRTLLRTRIIPSLDRLTEEDSIQFDKVITARKERDEEKDHNQKEFKAQIALSELRIATELPIAIARYSYNVGRIAAEVFDYGYKDARGESAQGVCFSASVMYTCLFIIEANLQKLPVDDWTERTIAQKKKLEEQQEELERMDKERYRLHKVATEEHIYYERMVHKLRAGNLSDSIKTDQQLEKLVNDIHELLLANKDKIWKKDSAAITNFIHILRPHEVLQNLMNYSFEQKDSLGLHLEGTEAFEVAGLIDKTKRKVEISRQFPVETMRFTAAHELGHAILHRGTVLHRDRGVDGTKVNRDPVEKQADKFAALFLMPGDLISEIFQEIFVVPVFTIDENTVLQLGAGSISAFRQKCVDVRGLGRELATARRYGAKVITPLTAIFGVSATAMAIRLEELGLIQF